ncbi:MAG: efflux RND transporter periplasmic adaptor subunit [bacterium]
MKKIIRLLIILILIGLAFYLVLPRFLPKKDKNLIEVSGTIETTEVDASFQIPGKIKSLKVDEGDRVTRGQILAVMDTADLLHQRDIAMAALDAAKSQVPSLESRIVQSREMTSGRTTQARAALGESQYRYVVVKNGLRRQEREQAQKDLDAARTSMNFLKAEYERAERLSREGAMPGQQKDSAKTSYDVAVSRFHQAEERLSLALEGSRIEDVRAAGERVKQAEAGVAIANTSVLDTETLLRQKKTLEAQIRQAKAALSAVETQLSHSRLYAPITGVVLVKAREAGEVVSPGTPIFTLGIVDRLWLKAYISETDLGRVKLGQKVEISNDSYPGKMYEGKVNFIASEAEFTPKNLQTKEDRVKLVYKIKVVLDNPKGELKPGMIADGIIRLAK